MRVLVTGSRYGFDKVNEVLDSLKDKLPITEIITGGANGVDSQAIEWARMNGITYFTYKANWLVEGKAAGPKRNQRMIDEGKPEHAIIFPGGKGTADCAERIYNSNIEFTKVI
jgi:hypothetical protein